MSDIDPLSLLSADLHSNDYETINQSINQLVTVAIALGPERARTQLIPLLADFAGLASTQSINQSVIDIENDEAQAAVARQLSLFAPLLGGPQYLHCLLPLLEKYCGEEELVVRNTAVQSLNKLIPLFPKPDLISKFIPILKRLSNGDWFTTRVSACGLFSITYQSISQSTDPTINQQTKDSVLSDLRSLFYNLCNDDTPMVRKAAFTALPDYAYALRSSNQANNQPSNQFFKTDVLPIVKAISIDDMDVMRVHAVDVVASLINQSIKPSITQPNQTNTQMIDDAVDLLNQLMSLIDGLIDDQSWRVRASLAKAFSKVSSSARLIDLTIDQANPSSQPNNQSRKMWGLFVRLMKDRESEVRASACEQLDDVLAVLVSDQTIEQIKLANNPGSVQSANQSTSQSVNQALAREFFETCASVLESLTTDVQQNVRMNLSKALINVCSLFKQPNNQANNPHSDLVYNVLIPRLHVLARDESYEVRHCSLFDMETLLNVVGMDAVMNLVVPVLIEASKDVKWRVRYSCLHACSVLAYHMGAAQFDARLLPCLISALSDHVYGVRQLACRQLGLIASIEQLSAQAVQPNDAFGPKWAAERMLPLAFVLFDKTTNYRHRMTVLLLIEQVAACYARRHITSITMRDIDDEIVHTHETTLIERPKITANGEVQSNPASEQQFAILVDQHCAPIIAAACNDAVANVRVAAAKTLTVLAESEKIDRRTLLSRFQPLLTKMTTDQDPDTAFFAQVALRALGV